jgi:HEPN domain-containing protein
MPHDPERIAEARSWFAKAGDDLRAATFELTAEPPLTSDIVFHAQQAVEKAIKGFLGWHDRPFRKTHNLVEIGEAAAVIDSALEPLLRRAAHRGSSPRAFRGA